MERNCTFRENLSFSIFPLAKTDDKLGKHDFSEQGHSGKRMSKTIEDAPGGQRVTSPRLLKRPCHSSVVFADFYRHAGGEKSAPIFGAQ